MANLLPEAHAKLKNFFQETLDALGLTSLPIKAMGEQKMPFLSAEKINELVQKADADGSQSLDANEAASFMVTLFKAVFDEVDTNKNGTISFEEFHAIGTGITGSDEERLRKEFADADTNGDGKLDLQEFYSAVMSRM